MRSTRWLGVALVAMLAAGACTSGAAPSASAPASASAQPTPAASPTEAASMNPEAVIPNVEDGAEITFWTFYLSPTFDDYIQATIDRFEETYPGVTVDWEDHQATFLDDYRNAFAAGNAPDVANLSNNEGWVREFAEKDLLLSMTDSLPADLVTVTPDGADAGARGGVAIARALSDRLSAATDEPSGRPVRTAPSEEVVARAVGS